MNYPPPNQANLHQYSNQYHHHYYAAQQQQYPVAHYNYANYNQAYAQPQYPTQYYPQYYQNNPYYIQQQQHQQQQQQHEQQLQYQQYHQQQQHQAYMSQNSQPCDQYAQPQLPQAAPVESSSYCYENEEQPRLDEIEGVMELVDEDNCAPAPSQPPENHFQPPPVHHHNQYLPSTPSPTNHYTHHNEENNLVNEPLTPPHNNQNFSRFEETTTTTSESSEEQNNPYVVPPTPTPKPTPKRHSMSRNDEPFSWQRPPSQPPQPYQPSPPPIQPIHHHEPINNIAYEEQEQRVDYPYELNNDPNPEIIHKKTDQVIDYTQEVAVRYLKPPTPPPPGDIIIRQEPDIPAKPPEPLVIRQQPERPVTPEPIVIREQPPQPPEPVGTKLITISGKEVVPPRQVIVEKAPPIPPRPPPIILERWLPYPKPKRKIIYEKSSVENKCVYQKPKNIIIEWDPPDVEIEREVKELGVSEVDPNEYKKRYGPSLINLEQMPKFLQDIKPSNLQITQQHYSEVFLEGDVEALSLIDLDAHGLSHIKDELNKRKMLLN